MADDGCKLNGLFGKIECDNVSPLLLTCFRNALHCPLGLSFFKSATMKNLLRIPSLFLLKQETAKGVKYYALSYCFLS